MKTGHLLTMTTLAVGIAITSMMMISCSKEDNPVEELDGAPGAVGSGYKVDGNWIYRVSGNDVILTGYIGADKDTLTTLTIPLNVGDAKTKRLVTYISGSLDFREFKKLETLNFDSNCHIDEMPSVKGCSTLQHVNGADIDILPRNMKTVKGQTFRGTAIKNIDFYEVESVGGMVFVDCENLESVNILNANVHLNEDAFAYIPSKCTIKTLRSRDELNWTHVAWSPQIIVVCRDGAIGWCGDGGDGTQENYLYWKCRGKSLTIASAQQGIDNYPDKQIIKTHRWLDYSPTGINNLELKDVYAIGKESFKGMEHLWFVTLNDGLTSIGESAFENCTSLGAITIPASVTNIGNLAFKNCTSLTSFTIPASVTNIGNYAFANCINLKSITIPTSVTNIGFQAFWGCISLKEVIIEGNPTIGEDAFPDGVTVTYVKDE